MSCIEKEELQAVVPHRGKMLLVDRIVSYDTENWALDSETDISESYMFYDRQAGGVPSWTSFELMAQSISALSGLVGRGNGIPAKIGFILSVTNMTFSVPLFAAGTTVRVEVRLSCKVDAVYSFNCKVFCAGTEAGSGSLTVMETDDTTKF